MGYDLIPRNKKIDSICIGAFSWPIMLDMGVGAVIKTGAAMNPASYSFVRDKKGRDPNKNDGFYVTAEEARAMGMVAEGLWHIKTFINKEWDKLTEEEKEQYKKFDFYKQETNEKFLNLLKRFAEFAYNSQGFGIW
jgi:homoserine acetyltransferase